MSNQNKSQYMKPNKFVLLSILAIPCGIAAYWCEAAASINIDSDLKPTVSEAQFPQLGTNFSGAKLPLMEIRFPVRINFVDIKITTFPHKAGESGSLDIRGSKFSDMSRYKLANPLVVGVQLDDEAGRKDGKIVLINGDAKEIVEIDLASSKCMTSSARFLGDHDAYGFLSFSSTPDIQSNDHQARSSLFIYYKDAIAGLAKTQRADVRESMASTCKQKLASMSEQDLWNELLSLSPRTDGLAGNEPLSNKIRGAAASRIEGQQVIHAKTVLGNAYFYMQALQSPAQRIYSYDLWFVGKDGALACKASLQTPIKRQSLEAAFQELASLVAPRGIERQ